jgi:hypothetical protein
MTTPAKPKGARPARAVIHPELDDVFDEIDAPTHAGKRDVHDQLRPITRLAAAVIKQMVEHKARVQEALLAPHDEALDGYLEAMKQTYDAGLREAHQLQAAADSLGNVMAQLERYGAAWKQTALDFEERAKAKLAAETASAT